MQLSPFDIRTRFLINRFFVDQGHAPTTDDLAAMQLCSSGKISTSLRRLQDDHRLVLFPGTQDIWIAHPFTTIPSNYWIDTGHRGWWGNCGFCALGIAAMLGENVSIHTHSGAEYSPIHIDICNGSIEPRAYQLHIPLPIARWHDNIVYTCGNVHYFVSRADIPSWCKRHHVEHGQVVAIGNAWTLAQAWYGDYLDHNWRPRGNAETNVLLKKCGLDDSFWHLPVGKTFSGKQRRDSDKDS